MFSLYLVFAILMMVIALVSIQKIENDGAPLAPFQYFIVLFCGIIWPIVLALFIMDYVSNKNNAQTKD